MGACFRPLSLLLLALCWSSCSQGPGKKGEEQITKALQGEFIQKVTLAGQVVPVKKAMVLAPYNGHVKKLFVKIGQIVKVGDPLVSVSQSLMSMDEVFPLRSPIEGTVVLIEKNEGDFVREGDIKEFILRVDDLRSLVIFAQAPEIDWSKLRLGQEVVIKTQGRVDRTFQGKVKELSLAARALDDSNRGQMEFPVKIEVTSSEREGLTPGMSVVVDVVTARKGSTLSLPYEYINQEKEQYFVTLKNGEKRKIEVGLQNELACEILSGLTASDEVRMVDFSTQGT